MIASFPLNIYHGVSRQARVVGSLTVREIRLRNSKHAFGQLFDLLEAVIFVLVHWVIFVLIQRKLMIGDSLLLFIATGVLPFLLFRTISIRVASAVEAAKSVTSIPYIQALDYSIARMNVEFIAFTTLFSLFFVGIYQTGFSKYAIPYNLGDVYLFLFLVVVFSFGIGLINSFINYIFPLWKFIWAFFSKIQIFLSAVFFIPEYMPPQLKYILSFNPLMHFVALFRVAFYPTYPTDLLSVPYIAGWSGGVLCVGLALERALRNHRANGH